MVAYCSVIGYIGNCMQTYFQSSANSSLWRFSIPQNGCLLSQIWPPLSAPLFASLQPKNHYLVLMFNVYKISYNFTAWILLVLSSLSLWILELSCWILGSLFSILLVGDSSVTQWCWVRWCGPTDWPRPYIKAGRRSPPSPAWIISSEKVFSRDQWQAYSWK